jgi:hypothetical protein
MVRDRPGNRCRRNSTIRAKRARHKARIFLGDLARGRYSAWYVQWTCHLGRMRSARYPIRKCHKIRKICNIPTPAIKAGNYAKSLAWKTISHRFPNCAALWHEPSPHVILCATPAPFLDAPGHRAGGTQATPYPATTRWDQAKTRVPRSRCSRVALAFASSSDATLQAGSGLQPLGLRFRFRPRS